MQYTQGRLINDGGEGYIYETQENPNLLMKMYKEKDLSGSPIVTPELHDKLEYMKNNPPEVLISKGIVAWPLKLLKDEQGTLIGFIMPRVDMDEHLQRGFSYRHPILDASEYNRFPSVKSRISIAINLCAALHELHRKGYVIGDFNHHNIGVNYRTGQIYFVDCDSFHITDDKGTTFRTSVIMAGYLAPEIIQHCQNERTKGKPHNLDKVSLPTFTKESDLFCLAIHIFKLLMNGIDPFRGVKSDAIGSTASPFVGNDAIERNAYVFREGNRPSAVFCPPANSLPPEILALFSQAFIDGRKEPALRPNATSWYNALNNYLSNELVQCSSNEKHHYYKMLLECPYCIADNKHLEEHEPPSFVQLKTPCSKCGSNNYKEKMYRIYYQEKGLTYDEEELVKVCVICGEVYKPKKQKNKTWATVLAVAAMIVVVIAFAMNNNQQSDLVPTENPTIGVYQETAQAQQADLPPQTQAHEPTPTPEQPQETSEPVQESTHEPTPTLSPEPTQEHPAMSSPTPTPIETIQVANVVGMSQSSARSTLQNQGFTVSAHENFNNTVASGVVISQYPSAGTMLSGGSEISLTISKGREPAGSIIIQYNANGGSGAPASHSVMKTFDGDTIYLTLSSVIPNRQGYTFLYWLFENDANYGAFWPGNEISFTLSPGSVTGEQTSVLYAQWEAEPTPTPIETIQVANVVGWSQNDAKNTLQNQGFSVSINEEFSGTVASGNIISQSPSAGSSHAVSSTVTITVSRGQETVQVANVVGWSQNDARSTLHNQGFSVTVNEEFSSTVASGNVISQSPSAGSSHAVGSTVTITVSRGQDSVRVDNVVGMWMIDAERSITNQGFVVSWSYAYSDTVEFGRIISQSPAADASITRGSTINLIASQGRQPAPTPVITLTVIVNYDANGGSGAPASHGAITIEREDNSASGLHDWYSFSFILSTTIPTREGYTFQWWSIDGGIYNPGATMRFGTSEGGLGPRTVSFTYRAVWRNNATGTLIR